MKKTTAIEFCAIFIALVLVLTAFTACGNNGGTGTTTPSTTATGTDVTTATTTVPVAVDVPVTDWGGKTIMFLARGPLYNEWVSQDIYAETENGTPINDAVYKRNTYLKDTYNFNIQQYASGTNMESLAEKAVQAGTGDYQVFMCATNETYTLATKGMICDLNDIQYLNLQNPCWDQNSIAGFTIDGKTPFMTGDLSIMANDATWVLYFNKQLLQNYGLDDPYTLVNNNQWTIDKLIEMSKNISKDLDGDGKWTNADQYGIISHPTMFDGLFFGSGMRVSNMVNGKPAISMDSQNLQNVIDDTLTLMNSPNGYNISTANYSGSDYIYTVIQNMFENGQGLFFGEVLQLAQRMRATNTNFGILPLPKFDTNQQSFACSVHPTACMVSIPKSLSNDERSFTGFVLEAMATESDNGLVQAYYQTALEGQYFRDTESSAMLDIITKSRRYDLGYIADWGGIWSGYTTMLTKNQSDYSSIYASKIKAANTAMQKYITAADAIQ